MNQEPGKIAVIKLSALGDIVMATGAFRRIRELHPKSRITLFTRRPFADFGMSTGFFDEVIVDNRERYAGFWKIGFKSLARGGFSVVYDLQNQSRTKTYGVIFRLFGKRGTVWHDRVDSPYPADLSFCHGPHENFGILPAKYALLIPGCSPNHPYKRWPVENYRALTIRLAEKGIKSVIMGTASESAEISAICRDNPNAVDFMGKSTLADIPDLARGARLAVGNDTGPSHMARVAGAKTISLFCEITRASAREAPNAVNLIKKNIADISVDDVLSAAEDLSVDFT